MNKLLYKYWFFFIKPEYFHLVTTETETSLLYAYTDNKEYADIFKSQRDLDKFNVIKTKITKDEVNHLAEFYPREYLLKKDIKTKCGETGSKIIDYELIITGTEYHIIHSTSYKVLMLDLWKTVNISPYIFNKKYFNMLKNIGFLEKYNILNSPKEPRANNTIYEDLKPDLLSTFIREFGFLLKEKD